jgi:hypothetical protein
MQGAQCARMEPPLIDTRIHDLFERLPLLVAFGWRGFKWGDEVYREINDEIWALVCDAEDEGANELLRGRTFARTLH